MDRKRLIVFSAVALLGLGSGAAVAQYAQEEPEREEPPQVAAPPAPRDFAVPPGGIAPVMLTAADLAYYRQLGLRDRQIAEGLALSQRLGVSPRWVLRRIVIGDPIGLIATDYQLYPEEVSVVRERAQTLVAQLPPPGHEFAAAAAPTAPPVPAAAIAAERIDTYPR